MNNPVMTPLQQLLAAMDHIDGELLLCRCCTAPITRRGATISIGLSDHYRFTNPAGISFTIQCYQHAPGCTISGIPSDDHSWFGGYYWQLALCAECSEHLGWYYQNRNQRSFFGLITARLIRENDQ